MNRLICFLVALFAFNFTTSQLFAQWTSQHVKADPLTKTEEHYIDVYMAENGDYFMSRSHHDGISIYTSDGFFNFDTNSHVHVVVGFYVGQNLIERKDVWLYVPAEDPEYASTNRYKQKKIGRKIKDHLRAKGSIKIIADRYSKSNFEITIPMNPNIK